MRLAAAIIGLLSVIATSLSSLLAQTGAGFAENHDRGEFYIKKHDIASAIPLLQKAYDIDPNNEDNAYDLALAYLERGFLEKTRAVVTASPAVHNKAELHNLLGELETKESYMEPAAEQYRTAGQMNPTEKNLFDLESHLLQYRGFEAAQTVFAYAVGRYPNSAELNVGLGIADYSLGKYGPAIDQLCRAAEGE